VLFVALLWGIFDVDDVFLFGFGCFVAFANLVQLGFYWQSEIEFLCDRLEMFATLYNPICFGIEK
jgi:hypothetical protein